MRINLFFILLILNNCVIYPPVPRNEKRGFDFCYDGKETGLDTLINLDGYYEIERIELKGNKKSMYKNLLKSDENVDSLIAYRNKSVYVFFRDGMAASSGLSYEELMEKKSEENMTPGELKNYFVTWGNYKIEGDYIVLHQINRPTLLSATWFGVEVILLIEDVNTLRRISLEGFDPKIKSIVDEDSSLILSNAIFRSSDFLPSTDVWLKDKRWFRCAEK